MTSSLNSYGRPLVDDDDIDAVKHVLTGDYLTCGDAIPTFEKKIAEVGGSAYALCCANGTAALHMAAYAVGIGPGKSVIVPSVTFLATANVVRMMGGDVVFCDVHPETGLMEAYHIEEAISRCHTDPYAVIPVHLAGQVCDMPSIAETANKHGLKIIEDASHAFGSNFIVDEKKHSVGDCAFSEIATFSFHAVKNITTGEGGAVVTNNASYQEAMQRFRSHGMVREAENFEQKEMAFYGEGKPNPWYYEMPDFGFNYRLTDIQAALGSSQIGKLQAFKEKRKELKNVYDQCLRKFSNLIRPISNVPQCDPFWHVYPVLIDFEAAKISRGEVMDTLKSKEIASQVHYIPVHLQPYYRNRNEELHLPGAEGYYARTLTLPLHPGLAEQDIQYAVETLADIVGASS